MAEAHDTTTFVEVLAPGRVNLIGDHTDTTGGWVLPMAIDRWTTVRGRRGGDTVRLRSVGYREEAVIPLDAVRAGSPGAAEGRSWTIYVEAIAAELARAGRVDGFVGTISSTVPPGEGLASSAALEVGVALALGASGDPIELARLCRRAEHRATGTPTGIMDQLTSLAAVAGHALLIDCTTMSTTPVPLPPDTEVVVVASGARHVLADSAYAARVAECHLAEAEIGPLRDATLDDLGAIVDPTLRARARHVVTENERVHAMVDALCAGDLAGAGHLMAASHMSLRDEFAVSVPPMDALVDLLLTTPGVFGARMTGGGFGGSAVALCRPGALDHLGGRAVIVRPVGGAVGPHPR